MASSLIVAAVVAVVVVVSAATPTVVELEAVPYHHSRPGMGRGGWWPHYRTPTRHNVGFPSVGLDVGGSSFQITPMDDLDDRIMEVRKRCQDDFLLLRRLLERRGGFSGSGPHRGFPWFFSLPRPAKPCPSCLPQVPKVDELPDRYDNATHSVHVVNGSRVEVNTTTYKDTDGATTTFLHTEVIHILPDEETGEDTPEGEGEEVVPEEVVPEEEEEEEEEEEVPEEEEEVPEEEDTVVETPEEPPVEEDEEEEEEEDVTGAPFLPPRPVPAELVMVGPEISYNEIEAERAVPRVLAAWGPRSASYVKGRNPKTKERRQPPRDLSGDTLVNLLPGDAETGRSEDPDAEVIHEELHVPGAEEDLDEGV